MSKTGLQASPERTELPVAVRPAPLLWGAAFSASVSDGFSSSR